MNTTDQTFIRAYGSDFVPSYADEAARDADYPALADSNVNAVFGSLPQPYLRVDGPSATPNAAGPIQNGVMPAPLPARTYVPQPAAIPPALPTQPTHVAQQQAVRASAARPAAAPLEQAPTPPATLYPESVHGAAQDAPLPHSPLAQPATEAVAAKQPYVDQAPFEQVPVEHVREEPPRTTTATREDDDLYRDAVPATPVGGAPHARVPRPHINFAAVKNVEPQPTDVSVNAEPQIEVPQEDASPMPTPNLLSTEDGLSVLADSSVLIGSSVFEWPIVQPVVAEAPTVAKVESPAVDEPAVAHSIDELTTELEEVRQAIASIAEPPTKPVTSASVADTSATDVAPAEPQVAAPQVAAPEVAAAEAPQVVAPQAASPKTVAAEAALPEPATPEVAADESSEVEQEAPAVVEPPLSPAIANVDKEATGAAIPTDAATQTEVDEPVVTRQKLKPAWEVDRLLWPTDVDQLYESEGDYFRHAGEKLRDASHEGLRVLGVSSSHVGEGCTTLAICLARAAAAAGAKVALLDANLRSPQLGTALGLDFARSWHETLDGTTALAEAAVTAIADNVTLMPLSQHAARQGLMLDNAAVNEVLRQASETFDLVLVDVGSPSDEAGNSFRAGDACPLDAAIIVRDVRATSEEETLESVSRFRALGIEAVGIAENFAASGVTQAAA